MHRVRNLSAALLALILLAACGGGLHGLEGDGTPASQHVQDGQRLLETPDGKRRWADVDQATQLSDQAHAEGKCPGYRDVTNEALRKEEKETGAAITAIAPTQVDELPAVKPTLLPEALDLRAVTQATALAPWLARLSVKRLAKTVEKLAAFPNRNAFSKGGVEAMNWIKDEFAALAQGRPDVTIEVIQHDYCEAYSRNFRKEILKKGRKPPGALHCQPSVIVRIAGTGDLAREKVILGAHGDSIGEDELNFNARAPGADDNASGVATLLEIYHVILESGLHPQRTIEFMVYAGEEYGLLGSGEIADRYTQSHELVVGMAQFDMTMFAGSGQVMAHRTNATDAHMNAFLARLNSAYTPLPLVGTLCDEDDNRCSDYASWTAAGVPAISPFESTEDKCNPAIHSDKDLPELLDPAFGLNFARLGLGFAMELATEPATAVKTVDTPETPVPASDPAIPGT